MVEEWRQSGMTKGSFAQSRGIFQGTLEYWIRKVRETGKSHQDDTPEFIELCSAPKTEKVDTPLQLESLVNPQIVLTFPSGLCLKIYG
jgi:transposase-like protein